MQLKTAWMVARNPKEAIMIDVLDECPYDGNCERCGQGICPLLIEREYDEPQFSDYPDTDYYDD